MLPALRAPVKPVQRGSGGRCCCCNVPLRFQGAPSASSLPLRSGSPQEEPPASAEANCCCRSFDKAPNRRQNGSDPPGSPRSSRRPAGVCPHQPAGCAEALLPAPGATAALAGTGAARAAGLTCVWSRRAGQQRRNSRNSRDNREEQPGSALRRAGGGSSHSFRCQHRLLGGGAVASLPPGGDVCDWSTGGFSEEFGSLRPRGRAGFSANERGS